MILAEANDSRFQSLLPVHRHLPPQEILNILITAILCLVVGVAAVGNAILLFVILHSKEHRHKSDFFIASFAAADFLMCVAVFPLSMMYQLHGIWKFGDSICKFWTVMDVALCAVAIYSMSAICMNVCFHVRQSFQCLHQFMQTRICYIIAAMWLFSFFIAALPVILGYELVASETQFAICLFNEPHAHALIVTIVVFVVPVIWTSVLYGDLLTQYLDYVRFRQANADQPQLTVIQHGLFTVTNYTDAIVTTGVKLGIFFFSWAPYFVIKVLYAFCRTCDNHTADFVAIWLPYLSSWVTPFIYGMLNKRVHERMKELCGCCKGGHQRQGALSKESGSWQLQEAKRSMSSIRNENLSSAESGGSMLMDKQSTSNTREEYTLTRSNIQRDQTNFSRNQPHGHPREGPQKFKSGETEVRCSYQFCSQRESAFKVPSDLFPSWKKKNRSGKLLQCQKNAADILNTIVQALETGGTKEQTTTNKLDSGNVLGEIKEFLDNNKGDCAEDKNILYPDEKSKSGWECEYPATDKKRDVTVAKMAPRKPWRSVHSRKANFPFNAQALQATDIYTVTRPLASTSSFRDHETHTLKAEQLSLSEVGICPSATEKRPYNLYKAHEKCAGSIQKLASNCNQEAASHKTHKHLSNELSGAIVSETLDLSRKAGSSYTTELFAANGMHQQPEHGHHFYTSDDNSQEDNDNPMELTSSDGNTEAENSFWGSMTLRPSSRKRRKLRARTFERSQNTKTNMDITNSASDSSGMSFSTSPQGLLARILLSSEFGASTNSCRVQTSDSSSIDSEDAVCSSDSHLSCRC